MNQNKLTEKLLCILFSVVKKWRVIICVALICGFSLDIFKTVTYQPKYSATMKVILNSDKFTYNQMEETQGYTKTLNYIFNGQVVKDYLKKNMGKALKPYTCNLTSSQDTNITTVTVISETKKSAYESLSYIQKWYQKNANSYNLKYQMEVLEKPTFSYSPMNPNSHIHNVIKGGILGAGIIVLLLAFFSYITLSVKNEHDIEENIDCRLFAKIPREKKPRSHKFWKKNKKAILVTSIKTSFAYKESIKKLRHKIERSASKHNYKSIMVTSTDENEGKSSICANLALSLAMKDYKVLLIDCDFRKPAIQKIFELKNQTALNSYFEGKETWQNCIQHLEKPGMDLLTITQEKQCIEEYLSSQYMKDIIEEASEVYDYVLIDSAPAGYLNDSIILNQYVDTTLLVIKQDCAGCKAINDTIYRLMNVKNNLLGCVYIASIFDFTKQKLNNEYRYGYDRYYSKGRRMER